MDYTYLSYTGLKAFMKKLKSYFTPQSRTVNKKALTADVTVGTDDILYDGTRYDNNVNVTDLIDRFSQSIGSNTTAINVNATNISKNSDSIESLDDRVSDLEGSKYELPVATSTELGGIKTGYTDDGDTGYRFGVQLEDSPSYKAYVELPIEYSKGDYALMTQKQSEKLASITLGNSSSIMRGDGKSISYYADKLSLMGLYGIDQQLNNGQNELLTGEVTSSNVVAVVQDLLDALRNVGVLTPTSE